MDQGLTKKQIDDFYLCVDQLGLKFPVAVISKKTGWSKGNVSDYLNRKKEPSENFLKAFFEAFQDSSKNVPRETEKNAPVSDFKAQQGRDLKMETIYSLAESNKKIADSNALLAESNRELVAMVKTTASDQPESSQALTAILPGLQKILVEFGMGRLWKNQREGQLKVSKWLFGTQAKAEPVHSHDGSGK